MSLFGEDVTSQAPYRRFARGLEAWGIGEPHLAAFHASTDVRVADVGAPPPTARTRSSRAHSGRGAPMNRIARGCESKSGGFARCFGRWPT